MQITIHTEAILFEQLQPSWDLLAARTEAIMPFLSSAWQAHWWDTYHPGDLWVLTAEDEQGTIIGIAPWFIDTQDRVVRAIGCVDVTDYLDILVEEPFAEQFIAALARTLAEHRSTFARVNLCNIPEGSLLLKHLPTALTANGFTVAQAVQEVCPQIALPENWEAYLEALDKKQRHELRRKLRRMEGEIVEHRAITGGDELNEHIELFLQLMRSSHPEKAAFLANAQNEQFFRAVMPELAVKGWLRLTFLLVEGVPCAAYCHFDHAGHIRVYNSGLEPEKNAHLSPGIVLLCYDIQWAIEHDRHVFDFLRGNETYKYRMGGVDNHVCQLLAE